MKISKINGKFLALAFLILSILIGGAITRTSDNVFGPGVDPGPGDGPP